MTARQKPAQNVWQDFTKDEQITEEQLEQFKRYVTLLQQWNEDINLTAITDLSGIVRQHMQDSLALRGQYDLSTVSSMADIGAGAGFPALPLKIMFPHLKVYLIEVTKKKQRFLQAVIEELNLNDVEIVDLDWRTFLRTTEHEVNLFVTRAALPDLELIRMFKPACRYNKAILIYWASSEWQPHKKVLPFIKQKIEYKIARKDRQLIFFGL